MTRSCFLNAWRSSVELMESTVKMATKRVRQESSQQEDGQHQGASTAEAIGGACSPASVGGRASSGERKALDFGERAFGHVSTPRRPWCGGPCAGFWVA